MANYMETLPNGFSFEMILIEGGVFNMGSADDDQDAYPFEMPQRIGVQVKAFYLAPFAVTQALWRAVMGEDAFSQFKGDQRPVDRVSWYGTQRFILALNEQTEESRDALNLGAYRLPSEAEWEYAARGGNAGGDYRFPGSDHLEEVGWYSDNSNGETHEVGLLKPNQLGLYDLCGNVEEWLEDHWHENYKGAPQDGRAWLKDDPLAPRVQRGGCYFFEKWCFRIAQRSGDEPGQYYNARFGFRLALSPRKTGE